MVHGVALVIRLAISSVLIVVLLLFSAAFNLTACGSDETSAPAAAAREPAPPRYQAQVLWIADDGQGNDVAKFCDAGRAVYVVDGSSTVVNVSPAIAVVPGAEECSL